MTFSKFWFLTLSLIFTDIKKEAILKQFRYESKQTFLLWAHIIHWRSTDRVIVKKQNQISFELKKPLLLQI